MRVDDLSGPRIRKEAVQDALEDLAWLGLDWDGEPVFQSQRLDRYAPAMRTLAHAGHVYPCDLTRREIARASSAPHAADSRATKGAGRETRFPRALRPAHTPRVFTKQDESTNWRFITPAGSVEFEDPFAGSRTVHPADTIGDFVVWTKIGEPAYQLATVVDDHEMGVTEVVRGDDLLDSAGRQLLLFRALGLTPEPTFWLLPLVVGEDGRRLAKRHGDTRLAHYREAGVEPQRVVALLARWSGFAGAPDAMTASDFAAAFEPATMARSRTVFTAEDDAWLRAGC